MSELHSCCPSFPLVKRKHLKVTYNIYKKYDDIKDSLVALTPSLIACWLVLLLPVWRELLDLSSCWEVKHNLVALVNGA